MFCVGYEVMVYLLFLIPFPLLELLGLYYHLLFAKFGYMA